MNLTTYFKACVSEYVRVCSAAANDAFAYLSLTTLLFESIIYIWEGMINAEM